MQAEPTPPPNRGDPCKLKIHKKAHSVVTPEGCTSVLKHDITSCSGNCISSSMAAKGDDFSKDNCSCCKASLVNETTIDVDCPDKVPRLRNEKFTFIQECSCSPYTCKSSPLQENVEVIENNQLMSKKRCRRALSRLFALPPPVRRQAKAMIRRKKKEYI